MKGSGRAEEMAIVNHAGFHMRQQVAIDRTSLTWGHRGYMADIDQDLWDPARQLILGPLRNEVP